MKFKTKGDQPKVTGLENQEDLRLTKQEVMPAKLVEKNNTGYNIYPSHQLSSGKIHEGYASLARWIADQGTVLIDGYVGLFWDQIAENLISELQKTGRSVKCWTTDDFLKKEADIEKMVAPFLGESDSVWGTKADLDLADFFEVDRLRGLTPQEGVDINLVVGTGAGLVGWDVPLIYIDLPKNELQYRMHAGSITNLGASASEAAVRMYKRFYFVDWVVCNQHKASLLENVEIFADGQGIDWITWAAGSDIRAGLEHLSQGVFRPRPWFTPGSWGGQWLKEHLPQLAQDEPNYGWSFEFIAPENGLVFASDDWLLEVSFDCLMFLQGKNVLGKDYKRFGAEFPIRFDFLDTFQGGKLSIQCHPSQDYIQKEFGEQITQDETYYILDCKEDAEVYLGFQEDIDPDGFRQELQDSLDQQTEVAIDRYVQRFAAHKHDFFLIPNGTVHSSGTNNLVLEISATPYIFTFKMYDWLSRGLDGQPRPINIEHAFRNLNFDRKGDQVARELISSPQILEQGEDWKIVHLPTHQQHFYDVHRIEFSKMITTGLEGSCEVMMLVEGSEIVLDADGEEFVFRYAETFVVPASVNSYTLYNHSDVAAKVIRAFVKL